MRKKLTDEQFYEIKNLRSKYPELSTKEFCLMIFAKGITDRVLAPATLYYIFPASSPDEFREKQKISKRGKQNTNPKGVPESDTKNTKDTQHENNKSCDGMTNDAFYNTIIDELKHTNHLLDAMFSEQKNTSRLIQQLIDLWRR